MKINSISPLNHKYLQIVGSIAKVPKLLHIRGELPESRMLSVAIVGSRRPSAYGAHVALELAEKLSRRGIVIISGLAYGIDAIAHKGALNAGGTTIAVLAGGLHAVYPRGHEGLARRITDNGGALVSEYEHDALPMKHHFLERNRLVSGLADAVIVVEAGERSGTLSTVTHALEQGRDVFAVPGPITSPQSIGPNRLIQQGAHPVLSVDDVLAIIAPHLLDTSSSTPSQHYQGDAHVILKLLEAGVAHGEQLLIQSQLTPSAYFTAMTRLEVDGVIRTLAGNRWALT
jgi:DNA processing protein